MTHGFVCFLWQITSGMHCSYAVALRPEWEQRAAAFPLSHHVVLIPMWVTGHLDSAHAPRPLIASGLDLSSHFTIPESGLNKSIISSLLQGSFADRSPFKESMWFSKSKQLNVSLKRWKLGWLTARGVAISHPTLFILLFNFAIISSSKYISDAQPHSRYRTDNDYYEKGNNVISPQINQYFISLINIVHP